MRKGSLVFLCGMLCGALPGGPALATANDPIAAAQGAQSAHDLAAAASYLKSWGKAYGDTGLLAADQPPFDILAQMHDAASLKQATTGCVAQAAGPKTVSALLDCATAAIKTMVAAEKLRDTKLFDSFAATVTQLGVDADAGKLSRVDAVRIFGILAAVFDGAALAEFENYLDHAASAPVDDMPPYDIDAMKAASDAFKQGHTACDTTTAGKAAAVMLACLTDNDAKFAVTGKLQDKSFGDLTGPLLRQAAADTDAGGMSRGELLAMHDYLMLATMGALDRRYGVYLNHFYSAQFDKRYAQAQAAHGKYVADKPANDATAAAVAQSVRDAAYAACAVPDAFKTSAALATCYVDANRAFTAASKMRDTDLFHAYADTSEAVASDADGGKITVAQRDSALAALSDRYNDLFQSEDSDYKSRVDKPISDAYVARFEKLYADAIAAHPLDLNHAAYDVAAVAKAIADRKKAYDQCGTRTEELKTQRAIENCELDADRAYALAIGQRDMALFDSYAATQAAVAADLDAGKITIQQAASAYAAVATDENDRLNKQLTDYQAQQFKPLNAAYVARLEKAYADASAAHPLAPDTLPYDPAAETEAAAEQNKANALCGSRSAEFKTRRVAVECILDSNRAYFSAIKMQDKILLDTFVAAARAVADDADTGKITVSQETTALAALAADENDRLNKQLADYEVRQNKPLIAAYVARFDKAYADARVAHGPLNPDIAPEDFPAAKAANLAEKSADNQCQANSAQFKTEFAAEECHLDGRRAFYAAVKMQDKDLLNALIAAEEAAATDQDAGKITDQQGYAVRVAIANTENDKLAAEANDYLAKADKPLVDARVARFLALYRTSLAAHGAPPSDTPPFDFVANKTAVKIHAASYAACDARVAELNTQTARTECRLDADRVYLAAIKIRDTALFEALVTVLHEAAAELDSGKLVSIQWNAVSDAIYRTYNGIRNDAALRYQMRQPLVIAHVRAFDNDYLAARKAAGPLPAGPPFDVAAAGDARDAYSRAIGSCDSRRDEFKTAAWAACLADASRNYATMAKLRDTVLMEKMGAALRRAADEADTGKISRDQLDAIRGSIGSSVNAILDDQVQTWKTRGAK